jgi:hypothetical protein
MTLITPELRQAIEQAGGSPVRLEDPETNTVYVLLSGDVYERLRSLLDDEISPAEMTRQMWEIMKDEWSDPSQDVYDSEPYAGTEATSCRP